MTSPAQILSSPGLVKANQVDNFLSEIVFIAKNKSWACCEKKAHSGGGGYYFKADLNTWVSQWTTLNYLYYV